MSSSWLERIESFHMPVNNRKTCEDMPKKKGRFKRLIEKIQASQLARAKIIVKENRHHW